MKFDTNGNSLWNYTYTYNSTSDDRAFGITSDNSGNIFVAGFQGTNSNDWRIMKFDSSGNSLWNYTYDSGETQQDIAHKVTNDSSNRIFVAGFQGTNSNDWRIMKFDFVENPDFCGSLDSGDTCIVTWTVNATGNINTYWKIDVNFTTSLSNIISADTDDATIKIVSFPNIQIRGIALYYYTGQRVNGNVTVIPVESPNDKETSTVSNGEWSVDFRMDTENIQHFTVIIDDNQKIGYNELKLDNSVTASLSCSAQDISLSGYSVGLNSENSITSGNVKVSILYTDYTNTTTFSGNWNIDLHPCLIPGKIYTLQVLISDNTGKRGEMFQKYPAR